jgi:hypothetical protein
MTVIRADSALAVQIPVDQSKTGAPSAAPRALDASPTIFLVAYEVLQAFGATGLEVHISAQVCLGAACTEVGRVKLSASDIADVATVVLAYLGGLGASNGGTVGSQPQAGFAPAATKMAALAASAGLWP